MVADAGIALSMDVYNGTYTDTVGREQRCPGNFLRRNFETTKTQRVVVEKAYTLGIPIMYGSDAGALPHDMGAWQFKIMVERGMAPMDAIKAATSVPADHMGFQADFEALEAGRFGDLIAVRGNPLEDMTIMRDVEVVIKGGLMFKLEK
ncbi:MAG: amidohydrolase family protein [Proteobacteria bacterium]|nr:amidohydrolase family protein [Pseudomonadota bacterium]